MTVVTEILVAEAMARGLLPSPSVFENAALYAMRFTGTGCAWRGAEYAYRPPEVYCTDAMASRIRGVPLIAFHPPAGVLNSDEFAKRVIGVVIYGYVRGEELWCIARVIDAAAATILDGGEFDTSPSVVFSPDENATIFVDGEKLLVEGEPRLIDHLAICPAGVWGAGRGAELGVEVSQKDERKVA
jgi:hypothetical protein